MKKTLLIAFGLLLLLPIGAQAIPIAADLTGIRSTADGTLVAADGWSGGTGNNGFQITWDITPTGTGYNYEYTISGEGVQGLSKELSHWILEVTNPSLVGDFENLSWPIDDGPKVFEPTGLNTGDQPNMPGNIYGVKWDTGEPSPATFTVSFFTVKDPIWGDFYAKDGKELNVSATAWNTNFGTDPDSENPPSNFLGWIATPNGAPSIPDPAAIFLLGSACLIGFAAARRKFIK